MNSRLSIEQDYARIKCVCGLCFENFKDFERWNIDLELEAKIDLFGMKLHLNDVSLSCCGVIIDVFG